MCGQISSEVFMVKDSLPDVTVRSWSKHRDELSKATEAKLAANKRATEKKKSKKKSEE